MFPIHRQLHPDACVAAAAVSVIDRLGLAPPAQAPLDALVQAGMRAGKSGFDSLADALERLRLPCRAVRHTPSASELVRWIEATPAARGGLLVSHHVRRPDGRVGAHITVVFRGPGEDGWRRADPANGSLRPIALDDLVPGYAGDVATIERLRGAE